MIADPKPSHGIIVHNAYGSISERHPDLPDIFWLTAFFILLLFTVISVIMTISTIMVNVIRIWKEVSLC